MAAGFTNIFAFVAKIKGRNPRVQLNPGSATIPYRSEPQRLSRTHEGFSVALLKAARRRWNLFLATFLIGRRSGNRRAQKGGARQRHAGVGGETIQARRVRPGLLIGRNAEGRYKKRASRTGLHSATVECRRVDSAMSP